MDFDAAHMNLVLAWLWILLGFASGAITGFSFKFFHEDWQGGYSGLKRRLYRLGHIAFFGLALINLMFYFTAQTLSNPGYLLAIASWCLAIGAITMPLFCFAIAHYRRLKYLFYLPVSALIVGGLFTFWEVLKQ